MKKLNLFILCLCFPFLVAQAAVPSRIVYQGRLSKSGVGAAGRHTITVQFVDAAGTNLPNLKRSMWMSPRAATSPSKLTIFPRTRSGSTASPKCAF